MSCRTNLDNFVRKYEKKHGVKLSGEQAEYAYFKKRKTGWAVFFGICGALTLGFELWLIFLVGRFDYDLIAWILNGLAVLYILWWFCAQLKEIREYPEKHAASQGRKKLTRADIAKDCRGGSFWRGYYSVCFVLLCVGISIFLRWPGSDGGKFGWLAGMMAVICALIGLFFLPNGTKESRQILRGGFLFVSAILLDTVEEADLTDGNNPVYYQFEGALPPGAHGKPGYYEVYGSGLTIGDRCWLVLVTDEKAAKKGIELVKNVYAYPADDWEPDGDLRQLLREM